jgi:hypothetical protein
VLRSSNRRRAESGLIEPEARALGYPVEPQSWYPVFILMGVADEDQMLTIVRVPSGHGSDPALEMPLAISAEPGSNQAPAQMITSKVKLYRGITRVSLMLNRKHDRQCRTLLGARV